MILTNLKTMNRDSIRKIFMRTITIIMILTNIRTKNRDFKVKESLMTNIIKIKILLRILAKVKEIYNLNNQR